MRPICRDAQLMLSTARYRRADWANRKPQSKHDTERKKKTPRTKKHKGQQKWGLSTIKVVAPVVF